MSGYSADSAREGGVRSVVSATLWAAGSVGAITAVTMWAFDLGARNPADVPALSAQGDWRARPAEAGGRRIPGQERLVYGPVANQPDAAATSMAEVISGAPAERAAREDLTGVPPLPEIAGDRGPTMDGSDFTALAGAAAAVTDANDRRTILLDDPVEPRRDRRDLTASAAPVLPPNVGTGAEPAPPNAVFYEPAEAVVGDPTPEAAPLAPAPAAAPAEDSGLWGPPAAETQTALAPAEPAAARAKPPISVGADDLPPDADAAAMDAPPGAPPAAAEPPRAAAAEPPAESAPPAAAPPPQRAAGPAAPPTDALIAAAPSPAPPSGAPDAPMIYQVQLGALDSVEAAERRWAYLQKKVPGVLGGYKLDIQPVNVSGARLYRLRVGSFANREGASELCEALRNKGVECFPASQ